MDTEKTNKFIIRIKRNLTIIIIYQSLLLLGVFILLYFINFSNLIQLGNKKLLNSILFGFSGSLIYFSRKTYVYLISSKLYKITIDSNTSTNKELILVGYYLYLIFRPFVGIIIGPLIFMLSSIGLVSFVKIQVQTVAEFSKTGEYFIYLLSFLAGHACSDMFDYFSKLARKIVIKEPQ